jgi:hypothetical protein
MHLGTDVKNVRVYILNVEPLSSKLVNFTGRVIEDKDKRKTPVLSGAFFSL